MEKLTRRGIGLAAIIRHYGYKVIESYPGAAQDILNIPRKSKGTAMLAAGLANYGITGDLNVSHDELLPLWDFSISRETMRRWVASYYLKRVKEGKVPKYELVELAAIYHADCESECDKCPLGKRIVEIPEQMEKLPENYTLCHLFDYMGLNKPDKISV